MSDQKDELYAMRHSLAHIMATAVQRLWPEVKLGVGPVVEHGFYYDIDLGGQQISEDDFKKIEKEMRTIISAKQPFEKSMLPVDEAIAWAQQHNQPYKVELLNDLKRAGTTVAKDLNAEEMGVIADSSSEVDEVSFYTNGDFTDLCRGPHVDTTAQVGAFKLMRVAGAYWRGDENKPQMQRLYGVAFQTKEDLSAHLQMLEEAKKRDHRKLGKEHDLFVLSDLVGPGLPLFTPRGTILRNELIKFSEELQRDIGYEAVWAPHMTKIELYKKSGHYDKYPERFDVSSTESDDEFMMKPMNCPHVTQIYASRPRSYRDLPLRLMETTTMYRDEKSGELHGLSRVRALTQDDSHAFVRHDQIESEIDAILEIVKQMYSVLDLQLDVDLSFKDDVGNYFGEDSLWAEAESILEESARRQELTYKIVTGEAAFYGPKIDIYITDALGRRWQCATVQLDFVQPERFELEYTGEDGEQHRPAMIHKAILGSVERFLSVYIEHTACKFPIWLAPEQVRIITVNQEESTMQTANTIMEMAKKLKVRAYVDNDNESVSKKIRSAAKAQVPYTIVIGEKEVSNGIVTPRVRSDIAVIDTHPELHYEQFLQTVANEAKSRIIKSSL